MRLDRYHPFKSQYIPDRNVEIWLPPDFDASGSRRYPVIYMHDGQNLFEPENAFIGVDWGIDEALSGMIRRGEVRPPIVVGIWNTENRLGEYMPEAALPDEIARTRMERFIHKVTQSPYELMGDAYLRFIVEELKPFIDQNYPTLPGPDSTFLMGSSMGGLISLYGLCCYPEVFGGAACLSNAWRFGRVLLPYFQDVLPDPAGRKLYLDMGGREYNWERPLRKWWLMRLLLYRHRKFAQIVQAAGYRQGANLLTPVFPEDQHDERAWRRRVHIPLRFLLAEAGGPE